MKFVGGKLKIFRMRKASVIIVFVVLFFANLCNLVSGAIINGWAGKDCGILGSTSGVICITDVQFKLNHVSNDVYSCPDGTWCANSPSICINKDGPACLKLPENLCGVCPPNVTSTCIAQNQYVSCVNNSPQESWKISCPPTEPFCTIDLDFNGLPMAICTKNVEQVICPEERPTEQPTTPSPTCPHGPTCPPPPQPGYCKPDKPHHKHPECEEEPDVHISVKITFGN